MEKKKNDIKKKQNDAKKKQEIPKGVKKKRIFLKKKQNIAVGVISIITIASIVGGIALYMNMPKGGDLIVGDILFVQIIDPHEYIDMQHVTFGNQVVEGLFDLDVNDPNNKIIPNLAASYIWSADDLELTCTLRQGVKFHDGTDFNAQAVKWTFDRLHRTIERVYGIETAPFWQFPDGRWIINETQVIDDYTVKFVLNEPYAPMLGLLTSWSASILSPSSTPIDEFIDLLTGVLVGTGPFIYDSYEPGIEVRMSPNPIYWGGKPAIDGLIFLLFDDVHALIDALLSGKIHILLDPGAYILDAMDRLPDLITNPSVIVSEAAHFTNYYLGMNNKRIPVEMRKAMAYAIDYDYFIYDIVWAALKDLVEVEGRMRSPIPKGILYSNTEDFDVPVLDLEIARKSLQDANWPGTAGLPLDEDGPWEALVDNDTPIATYNYSYNVMDFIGVLLSPLLQANSKKIGVKIVDAGMSWHEFHYRGFEEYGLHRDMFELFEAYWWPKYNDPSHYIIGPMSNQSKHNFAQINDHQLQTWMEQAVRETDPTVREELYYQIQKRFIEEIYPWCMIFIPITVDYHVANLRGYTPNFFKLILKNAYLV